MKVSSISVASLVVSWSSYLCQAGKFTDDLGNTYNFKGKPTVAVYGGIGARSLYHMGMGLDQIKAVYGIWHIRGSDLDYENPSKPTRYPDADPTLEEFEFLSNATNLSPECYTNPRGCQTMDYEILKEVNPDYFLYIDNGSIGKGTDIIANVMDIGGVKDVVFIDTFYDSARGCRDEGVNGYQYKNAETMEGCYARSMIDIATKVEELAVAMGVEIPDSVTEDKQELCEAAQDFSNTMKEAHERGVRTMAGIIRSGPGVRALEPIAYFGIRTFEELGMPIMHADAELPTYFDEFTVDTWFVDCPEGAVAESCNGKVAYPVDFWIIDSRSYPDAVDQDFGLMFPDKALLAGQVWHFSRNDGAVSYKAVTSYLKEMGKRIGAAQRLYDTTDCTDVDVLDDGHLSAEVGGLQGGQYACYNAENIQTLYTTCPS